MKEFWLCFVPLFVAVDAVGVLPFFIGLTEGVDKKKLRNVVFQSALTAALVAFGFLAIGKIALNLLGISIADFMVAGGLLLFALSLRDMFSMEKKFGKVDYESVGAVPIGVPLIVGPAVLTTTILMVDQHGGYLTSAALILNIAVAAIVFSFSRSIYGLLGKAGAKIFSKLANLILASIAVMMIRKGITLIISR